MFKILFGGCACSVLILLVSRIKSEEIYYDNYEDEIEYFNSTGEHDLNMIDVRRNEQLISELRPVYPVNHYYDSGTQNNFQELFKYKRPHKRPGLKKQRKLKKKGYKYIVPLLLSLLIKVANFLPIAKLTLLALFTLVLFSKKALLISIGSLILVIYDNFYKKHTGKNTVKDRASTVPTIDQESLVENNLEEGWWGRDDIRPSSLDYTQDNSEKNKRKRWWAPQINHGRTVPDLESLRNGMAKDELILNKFINKRLGF